MAVLTWNDGDLFCSGLVVAAVRDLAVGELSADDDLVTTMQATAASVPRDDDPATDEEEPPAEPTVPIPAEAGWHWWCYGLVAGEPPEITDTPQEDPESWHAAESEAAAMSAAESAAVAYMAVLGIDATPEA